MCVAHVGHVGNSGVQGHSAGDHFPINSYCIGSADHRVAEFCSVRRDSFTADDHTADLGRMKNAERITDAIFAARAKGEGCSVPVDGSDCPVSGYAVGLDGYETKWICSQLPYRSVYADVVAKLERIGDTGRKVCIGSWIYRGMLYCDVSVVLADYDDAVKCGNSSGQIAIYDLSEGDEITL